MKTIHQLLAATALLAGSFLAADASAQCYSFPAAPAISRFYRFQLDGRPFAFDRMTGDIFCNNIKIGVRTPDGQVSLLPGAGAQFGAVPVGGVVPGQPVVAPTGGAVAGVAPVGGAAGPAVDGAVGAPAGGAVGGAIPPQGGAAPIQGGVAPVQGAAPIQGGVAPAQGGIAPVQGGVAPAQGAAPVQNGVPPQGPAPGQAVPPAAGATPATLGPTATAGTPAANGGAIPVLGSGNDPALAAVPAIDPQLLAGQWRAETKDIFGETKISELNFEDAKNLSLRIQTQGNEPRLVEGAFEIAKDGNLTVKQDDENKDLGLISADNGQLVLKNGNEVFTFKKVEE